ncbi:hypothetical protein ACLOJK_002772 [Asimina triloba]
MERRGDGESAEQVDLDLELILELGPALLLRRFGVSVGPKTAHLVGNRENGLLR